jgi:hypothetical protein
MTISARGEYGLEGRDVQAGGRYAFTIVWTGVLQADGEDFVLVHGVTTLAEWTAEEKTSTPTRIEVLNTDDFPDKPELNVNYAIREADGLRFDFIVRGFDVPLGAAADGFYLHFPASAENGEMAGGFNYDLGVVQGSNAVTLDDRKIRKGPVEDGFRWSWKRRGWVQRQDQTILEWNSHSADVKIVVAPKD